jgi:hypothetical protein
MKKIIFTALAVLSLAACGRTTVKEVLVTTPEPTPTPITAEDMNKFDSYLNFLYDNSAQARSWSEDDLLKFGTVVCESFDNGASLDTVVTTMSNYSTGKYDTELFAAVISGAVTNLCPEWKSYVAAASS